MKLIKCYINNYKGIDSPQIIEFTNDGLTLFDGPNGYGKTTVFEAIELCLRGRLHKTKARANVTEDRSDYKKAFYQNDIDKDVIIKSHFRNSDGKDFIIIKFLSKDSLGTTNGGRKYKPNDWDILETYQGTLDDFGSHELDFDNVEEISQEDINNFFFPNSEGPKIDNTYLLFNYLQQEENIFFLKQSEHDKREQLDFLFKTENESSKFDQIKRFLTSLGKAQDNIEGQLSKLRAQQDHVDEVKYNKLIELKELNFDSEEPFKDTNLSELNAQYERVTKRLEDLGDFLENFSIDEYLKSKKREELTEYSQNDELLFAYILSKYISEDEFEELEKIKAKIDEYKTFLESENQLKELDSFLKEFEYDEDRRNAYNEAITNLSSLEKDAGTLTGLIKDLNDLRARLLKKYIEVREHQHEDAELADCPLCGTDFDSISELRDSIDEKRENLISAHKEKIEKISQLVEEINENFLLPVRKQIEEILSLPEYNLDDDFFKRVKESKEFDEFLEEFDNFLSKNGYQLEEYKLIKLKEFSEVERRLDELKNKISEIIEDIEVEPSSLKNSHLFKSYFEEDKETYESLKASDIDQKRKYLENKYYSKRLSFKEKLEVRLLSIKKIIDEYEKIKGTYDSEIRAYKKRMIDKVQIPFYLISGKILKHYPQGMGIFLRFKESNNSIRFITNNDSNHDVVHHLSAGQLAVVSIAFCFALNKVYAVNEHFKFLAIDDPVQTMDDINVHSLIELMRHGFSDYQILMSTHEDDISRYMKYKFEKFNFEVKRINVQEEFYS